MSASYYRKQLEEYLKTLDIKAERVIDVGGGSNPVSKRVKSWDVKNYHIMDNGLEKWEPTFIRWDINEPLEGERELYDLVFCLEVFDYVWNPVQASENLRRLCKRGGQLIVTFPFLYPNHNPVDFDMLRYTKQGAVKILTRAGFMIDGVIPRVINHMGHWKKFVDLEGYRARGGQEAGTFWDTGYIIIAKAI